MPSPTGSPSSTTPTFSHAMPAATSTSHVASPATSSPSNTPPHAETRATHAYYASNSAQNPPPSLRRTLSGTLLRDRALETKDMDDTDAMAIVSLAWQKDKVASEYQQLSNEFEKLQTELAALTSNSASGTTHSTSTGKTELSEKIKAIGEQLKITELKKQTIETEYDALQLAYHDLDVDYSALSFDHDQLTGEKNQRMEGARISAQKKLDEINRLKGEVKGLKAQLTTHAALQGKVVALEERERKLLAQLTHMGKENAVLRNKLTSYEDTKNRVAKEQKKADAVASQEESKTIQNLRAKLSEANDAVREAKADTLRQAAAAEAQRRLREQDQEKMQRDIESAVEKGMNAYALRATSDLDKQVDMFKHIGNMLHILKNLDKVDTTPVSDILLRDLDAELAKMVKVLGK